MPAKVNSSMYCWFEADVSIDCIVVAHIDRDDLLVLNQQFQRDAVGQVDRHRMHTRQSPGQGVQAQRGVERIQFEQL